MAKEMSEDVFEKRSALRTIKGTFRIFFRMTGEDWHRMDHKFFRLVFGGLVFIGMALFWLFFLRNIIPF